MHIKKVAGNRIGVAMIFVAAVAVMLTTDDFPHPGLYLVAVAVVVIAVTVVCERFLQGPPS